MSDKKTLKMYTLKDVAELLGLSPRTVYQYVHQGKLKGYKLPSGWRFYEADVISFIALYKARATKLSVNDE